MDPAVLRFVRAVKAACDELLQEPNGSSTDIDPKKVLAGLTPKEKPPHGPWCGCGHRESEHDENGCHACAREKTMGVIGCPGFKKSKRKRVREETPDAPTAPTTRVPLVRTIDGLPKMEGMIMWTLLQYGGQTYDQLIAFTKYRPSGSFQQCLARMRASHMIAGSPSMYPTESSRSMYASQVPRLPPKGARRREWFIARLSEMEGSIIDVVHDSADTPLTAEQVAEATMYKMSGSFQQAVARLRKLRVLDPEVRGTLALTKELVGE